jgi:hypothetical protein
MGNESYYFWSPESWVIVCVALDSGVDFEAVTAWRLFPTTLSIIMTLFPINEATGGPDP